MAESFRRHRGHPLGLENLTPHEHPHRLFPAGPGRLDPGPRRRVRGAAGRAARRAGTFRLERQPADRAAAQPEARAQPEHVEGGRPAGAVLCQAGPVPRDAAGRRRRRRRDGPRRAPGPDGDIPDGGGGGRSRGIARPALVRSLPFLRGADLGRLHRAGASGRGAARGNDAEGGGEGHPPRHQAPLLQRSRKLFPRRPAAGTVHAFEPAAEAGRGNAHAGTDDQGRDGSAARGGRHVGARRKHARGSRLSRSLGRLGTDRPRRRHHGVDRRHQDLGHRGAAPRRVRPQGPCVDADPVLPAPYAARRLLPCRHASRQSVRGGRRDHRRGRFRHRREARQEGAAVPRRDPLRLHHARLSARRRGAFRGRLRAAHP